MSERSKKVLEEIKKNNAALSEEDKAVKYEKMSESAFRFYRGTSQLFWMDLYNSPDLKAFESEGGKTWIAGDLHACNIGIFDNALDEIVFDITDFDEAILADFQYDLWRMAASIGLVARECLTISCTKEAKLTAHFIKHYLKQVHEYRDNNDALTTNFTKHNTKSLLKKRLKDTKKDTGPEDMLESWTCIEDGERKFNFENEKLKKIEADKYREIEAAIPKYSETLSGQLSFDSKYFKIKDIAQRLYAGTGSLGTKRYYILIQAASEDNKTDRILDLKLQTKPPIYHYMNTNEKQAFDRRFPSQGERFIEANNALNLHADNHLGYLNLSDGAFAVKQRPPHKADFQYEKISKKKHLKKQCKQWGKVIATAHARAADSFFKDEISKIYEKHLDAFRELAVRVAQNYTDTVIKDYELFIEHKEDL
jgi:uncharacterized protein (DUF2252 family)